MKTIEECIQFANDNPICFLATCEREQPRVRVLEFWFADHSGFYFQSASKKLPLELQENPKTEVCFYKHIDPIGAMLRISGRAEFLEDPSLKDLVMEERHFLKGFGLEARDPALKIFRITNGKAHYWSMDTHMSPKFFIDF